MALLTEEQAQLMTYDGFKQRFEGYVTKGMTRTKAYEETENDVRQISGERRYQDPRAFLTTYYRSEAKERNRRGARANASVRV